MFNQILLKLIVSSAITNLLVHMEELLKYCCSWMWGNQLTLKFPPLVMDAIIAFILDDHVMHDHASSYDLPHRLCVPCTRRVANNIRPRLEHTKYTLHILPACFLSLSKPSIFLLRWFTNCLHKSRPGGIDAISKVIALVVWMAIDLIVKHRSIALRYLAKTEECWSTLMSLWEPAMPKKSDTSKDLAMPRPQD
jgi:hypothetical protein